MDTLFYGIFSQALLGAAPSTFGELCQTIAAEGLLWTIAIRRPSIGGCPLWRLLAKHVDEDDWISIPAGLSDAGMLWRMELVALL